MKKSFVVSLSILCSLLIFAGCSSSTSSSDTTTTDTNWEKIEENKTLTVATSGTLYPASYYNDDNQLVGYDIDVIKEVAKRLDLKVKTAEYNVDGQLAAVQNGSADLIANDMSINETRAKKYTLSSPIKWSFGSMIVRKSDNSGITSFDDLKGKKAAGEATTNYMKIAESMGATLINYDNATNEQYLTDVANGRTDVILNDYYLQKMATAALPDVPVKILPDMYFNLSSSGFLMKKTSTTLEKKINQTIADMEKDGTLQKISETYYYADVTQKPTEKIEKTFDVDQQ